MRLFLLLATASVALGQGVTVVVPQGTAVNIVTNTAPPPPTPMSVQMRRAAQEASGKAAPWNQRFIVTKVDEEARTRPDEDENGRQTGTSTYSTNYVVTIVPLPDDETKTPVAWGVTKTKQIRLITTRPAKKGDEYSFFPLQ